ncbi:MAG: helix-turn-helix transcriptional regulator [Bacteroides sp.]|nr:helix-turn-helix transcriptional regulator [Bacteroides sp.]
MIDSYIAKLNRLLTETLSYFSYTLVLCGTATVNYNDRVSHLAQNDILIITPGMMIRTLEVSDDFDALCLMGDESTTFDIPYAHNVINASYFPAKNKSDNVLSLNDDEAKLLERRMRDVFEYAGSAHIYKKECLFLLFSIFILDLLNVEKRLKSNFELSRHAVDLFFRFMKLVTENFIHKHEISFYSDSLAVSSIYLSRIVKQISGQTVKNHIDRLLIMEASFLLRDTDEPIANIAAKLKFADSASFCKFFIQKKSMTPSEYRTSCLNTE